MQMPDASALPDNITDVTMIPGLNELWTETLGNSQICIAILDGPVDTSHPCLAKTNFTKLDTLVSGSANKGQATPHGTHIASVIFGNHDTSVKGIAPNCRGLIVPIFEDETDGRITFCSQLDLARAITQAVEQGAHIINISGGEFSPSGTAHPILADAVRHCAEKGVLIVAAAGNEGCDCLHIPGALPSVLTVGAMSSEGEPLNFSNWGEKYQAQGILAPGEKILGASPGDNMVTNSGTSYATPIISGIVALLLSLQHNYGQKLNTQTVRAALLDTAVGCDEQPISECRRLLAGRLNIKKAMHQIIGGGEMSDLNEVQEKTESRLTAGNSIQASMVGSAIYQQNKIGLEGATNHSLIKPSGCECGGSSHDECSCKSTGPGPQPVFALGTLGYDFGTEARRDSIMQHMDPKANNPYDPHQLLAHLNSSPSDAAAIIWTLSLDATVIYAVQSHGPFAGEVYKRLREFLGEQMSGEVERVSIPGYIIGKVRLFTGQVVPMIDPELRGMYSWKTSALVEAVSGKAPAKTAKAEEVEAYNKKRGCVNDFLERVYFEFRNLGTLPQDRAINYAATNAFNIEKTFESVQRQNMVLDSIEVERSPICRPDSDCWDAKLLFFDPENVLRPRKVYRFTVDVSDVVPVNVGPVRSWLMR